MSTLVGVNKQILLKALVIAPCIVDGDIVWAISCGPVGERSDAANLEAQERELHSQNLKDYPHLCTGI